MVYKSNKLLAISQNISGYARFNTISRDIGSTMPKIFHAQKHFIATWFKQMSSQLDDPIKSYFFHQKILIRQIFFLILILYFTFINTFKKMACKISIFIRPTLYNKLYKYRIMIRRRYWHAASGQSSLNDAKHRCQTGATREHVNDRITIEGFYYKGT